VVFRGFFLKVITYLAGDVWREAPLLIGRETSSNPFSLVNWSMIAR
jgi:hypothetical protein